MRYVLGMGLWSVPSSNSERGEQVSLYTKAVVVA
jgi:hypothetical protein